MANQQDGLPLSRSRILLFGSLALSFDASAFTELRRTITECQTNDWLLEIVGQLPSNCGTLTSEVTSLKSIGPLAREQLQQLADAVSSGQPLSVSYPLPNTILIPLMVIRQLAQYSAFYQEEHATYKASRANTKVLGLCTGLLAAFAVSCANSTQQLRQYGANAIRLALLVGLLVDSEAAASASGQSKSLTAAWSNSGGSQHVDAILRDFEEAYTSVYYDENRVTITCPATQVADLVKTLKAAGVSASEIELYGKFHSQVYYQDFKEVLRFCDEHSSFQLPCAELLSLPTWASDGQDSFLNKGSLHSHALESILLQPPKWIDLFSTALRESDPDVVVVSFGPERSVPPSLTLNKPLRVIHFLEQNHKTHRPIERPWLETDIAIIGMACKVSGANNLEEFWDLLLSGKSRHQRIDKKAANTSRFSFDDTPFRTIEDPNMDRQWYANLIDDYDQFDHRFFKKNARDSATMDPQQRHLLQIAYQAVEQSGYFNNVESNRDSNIGCFIGACLSDYEQNVACHAANAFTATGNLQGFIAGKVSHYFGWTGPGLTIDTACSSSLVAVHQACSSILSGECSMALAGGSHIMSSAIWFQNLAAGSFLSPTGQCKPFDATADGYCRGEGVGAVFLKKMSEAVADGDTIMGVIAATAVQQNENCTPVFVPNLPSLFNLFKTVTEKARIKPSDISVVEAHGTGTPVGDPVEYSSIRQVFGGHNRIPGKPLLIGSVKGLVGHIECTSGIISLIKVLLMLHNREIPAQASFTDINPALNPRTEDHMRIPTKAEPWKNDFRAALINNYGASGSNASMIVIEPPCARGSSQDTAKLLPEAKFPFWIGGSDENSLKRHAKTLKNFLYRIEIEGTLEKVSYHLAHQSNRTLHQGLICTATSSRELQEKLETFEKDGNDTSIVVSSQPPSVIFCFGGQVSTHIGLDQSIYENVAILRKHLDFVDATVQLLGHASIFPEIFQRSPVKDIVHLQLMLFSSQYACAQCWLESGIRPVSTIGHSFGELTALCISEILSLEDTVRMIAARARLVRDSWGVDKGSMMAVEAEMADIEKLLEDANHLHPGSPASIACYNGPRSFTIAGSTAAIDAATAKAAELPTGMIKCKRLNVTNAFHSALVDPLVDDLRRSAKSLVFRQPKIPLELSRRHATTADLTASFVPDHMRNPVYFHPAVERLARQFSASPVVFLEAGTSSTITTMASRALKASNIAGNFSFQGVNISNCNDGWNKLTDCTVSLWKSGLRVQHWAHHPLQRRHFLNTKPLFVPPYQFDRDSKHWMNLKNIPRTLSVAVEKEEIHKASQEQVTFMGYQDGPSKKKSLFCINTNTEIYKNTLSGHLTIGTAPICPATVQLSFILDAIGSLHPEHKISCQPQIRDVEYKSPVCQNKSCSTFIEIEDNMDEWHFEVFSTEGEAQSRLVHTTGSISFSNDSDTRLKQQLVIFERLFGHLSVLELLQSADVDEVLTNRSIYRMFAEIVDYGDEFRGLQKIVSRNNEVAGYVIRKNNEDLWFDPHLVDTFCQLGGLWVNCMTDRSPDDVYLASGIDRWIRSPISKWPTEFHVFARNSCPSDKSSLTDVFVFDATDGALIEVILGIKYVKIPKAYMERLLKRLTDSEYDIQSSLNSAPAPTRAILLDQSSDTAPPFTSPAQQLLRTATIPDSESKKDVQVHTNDLYISLKAIIADLSGLGVNEIRDDSDLADLGIDSLAGMEMVNEIEKTLKVKLPETEILAVVDMPGLMKCVAGSLGLTFKGYRMAVTGDSTDSEEEAPSTSSSMDTTALMTDMLTPVSEPITDNQVLEVSGSCDLLLLFDTVIQAFNEMRQLTDSRIHDMGQSRYVSESLPYQNELTVALTIEAFEELGAGFRAAKSGDRLSRLRHGKEHLAFVTYLYEMLQTETQIITINGDIITRTAIPLPNRHSKDLYHEMLRQLPDQHTANKLMYYAGVNLARVLSGHTDGVKLIFGCAQGRELVSDFYADWPLNRVMYAQMEDFLARLFDKLQSRSAGISIAEPLRILEMGAGTGGTTKRLVPLLAKSGIPLEYTFTDLAPSFVAAARKKWGKQYPWMRFRVHDIENAPESDLIGTQHFVIASNAVHATHSLVESGKNIRKFLRPDGFLFMLEMTRTPYWVDLIFGLFQGWWLFDDGRKHALTHEKRWQQDLQTVGYGYVGWTDGERLESNVERVILAAANPTSRFECAAINLPVQLSEKPISRNRMNREQVVVKYVNDLTNGFCEATSTQQMLTKTITTTTEASKCFLITGTTGGLGAHLVASAVLRTDVRKVLCLNRPSKQDAWERQLMALSKKGIRLSPGEMAKIEIFEADLSDPDHLGLSEDFYECVLENVTHMIHNAWLMHSKWPIKRFESQLLIMANMIKLARNISCQGRLVTFQFISSIATVGHHSMWTGKPIVPEVRVPIDSVLPTGYGEAKYICERMLDATLHQFPERFRATVVRLGQIGGSRINGHWNPMEHLSFIVKSSQTLRTLPDLPGTMGWTPADDVAEALIEIATVSCQLPLHSVYHIENPIRQPWRNTIEILADVLKISQDATGIIPFPEWIRCVRDWPRREDNCPHGANPGYLLIDFLETNFTRMSCGELLLSTENAREHSSTMATLKSVDENLIRLFIDSWKTSGFLA